MEFSFGVWNSGIISHGEERARLKTNEEECMGEWGGEGTQNLQNANTWVEWGERRRGTDLFELGLGLGHCGGGWMGVVF